MAEGNRHRKSLCHDCYEAMTHRLTSGYNTPGRRGQSVNVTSNGKTRSFTESAKSRIELQSNSLDFGTGASWPPRAF
jgi:hypothetical protein